MTTISGKGVRLTAVARAGRQPDVGIDAFRHKPYAAVAQEYHDAAGVVTAGGRHQLPPVAVRPPAGFVRRQQMVVPIAPYVPFVPGLAAVAPRRRPAARVTGRFPVLGQKSGAGCGQVLVGLWAELETIGAGIGREVGVGPWSVTHLSERHGVASPVGDLR